MIATIVDWNVARGFGFAEVKGTGEELFVHVTALIDRVGRRFAPGLDYRDEDIFVVEVQAPAQDGYLREVSQAIVSHLLSGDLSVA
jgi:cold shock CspA family protein